MCSHIETDTIEHTDNVAACVVYVQPRLKVQQQQSKPCPTRWDSNQDWKYKELKLTEFQKGGGKKERERESMSK